MSFFLFALFLSSQISLRIGQTHPLPPQTHVLRIFPPDLLKIEGETIQAQRGGKGVLIVQTPWGRRILEVEVSPYEVQKFQDIPPRWQIALGETQVLISSGDYTLQAIGIPEERVQLTVTPKGLTATCHRPGRSMVFYELRQNRSVQFGQGMAVCLPPWDPSELVIYLRTGETDTFAPKWWDWVRSGVNVWTQGGIIAHQTGEGIQIRAIERGRGELVIATPKRKIHIPVYVDIPPLFPAKVFSLPVDHIELPPKVDSIRVFPHGALEVQPDGVVRIHRRVRRAVVEVWKEGRVGVIILLGLPAPGDRLPPRALRNPLRRPPEFPRR